MKIYSVFLFLAVIFHTELSFCSADSDKYFTQFMRIFEKNTPRAMALMPPKFDRFGRLVKAKPKFSDQDIKSLNFFNQKIELRERLKGLQYRPFSEAYGQNRVEIFFPQNFQIIRNAEFIDKKLNSAKVDITPWSGDYWPTYRGGVGSRYADQRFPQSIDFAEYYSAYRNFFPIPFHDQASLNNLSPAEKYDILVGDDSFSMTKWTFEDANNTYKSNGNKIETWFGICHGWAPAAFMLPRPQHAIQFDIQNFSGNNFKLKFFPDDIKALASLLWANAAPDTNFLGGRCQSKNPNKDANGRITAEGCFDINPGAWHIATINQIAKNQASFVIDAAYDYEVWNQPVLSYELSYFQPQTKQNKKSLAEAVIPIQEYSKDKFKSYRSQQARFIVGVNMLLSYVVEDNASHNETNSEKNDDIRIVQYIYDLELNEAGEIIGGEWYQNVHPDFIWSVDKKNRASSISDRELQGQWLGNLNVPAQWSQGARRASDYGQPLGPVVEGLIQRARSNQ